MRYAIVLALVRSVPVTLAVPQNTADRRHFYPGLFAEIPWAASLISGTAEPG